MKPAARAYATAGFAISSTGDLRRRDRSAALSGDRLQLGVSALIVALTSGSARLARWTAWSALVLAVLSVVAAPLVAVVGLTFAFDDVAAVAPEDKGTLLSKSAGESIRALPGIWGASMPAVLACIVAFVRSGRMLRTSEPEDLAKLPTADSTEPLRQGEPLRQRASTSALPRERV